VFNGDENCGQSISKQRGRSNSSKSRLKAQKNQDQRSRCMRHSLDSTIPVGDQMRFSLYIESEAYIQISKRSRNSCYFAGLRCTNRHSRRAAATTRRCPPVAASSLATVMACCQVSRWGNSLGQLSAQWLRRRTRQQVRSMVIPPRIKRSTIPASSSLPKLWTEEDNYKVNFLCVHSKAAVTIQESNQISTSNAIYRTVLPTLSSN